MKPTTVRQGRRLELTRGYQATVDEEDFAFLNRWKWTADIRNGLVYARRNITFQRRKFKVYLHRQILCAPSGITVDHKNRNTLDNRRENLLLCTTTSNNANSGIRSDNKSGHRGISWVKKKKRWMAQIKRGKKVWVRFYRTRAEAIAAHNKAFDQIYAEIRRSRQG